LAECSYASQYYDYDIGNIEPYKCPVEEYSDGLCKFHHSRYYTADKKNKEQVTELLKQEVERANTSGKPLKPYRSETDPLLPPPLQPPGGTPGPTDGQTPGGTPPGGIPGGTPPTSNLGGWFKLPKEMVDPSSRAVNIPTDVIPPMAGGPQGQEIGPGQYPCPERKLPPNSHFTSITFDGYARGDENGRPVDENGRIVELRALQGVIYPAPNEPNTLTKGFENVGRENMYFWQKAVGTGFMLFSVHDSSGEAYCGYRTLVAFDITAMVEVHPRKTTLNPYSESGRRP
jgi:hypothetical protein